MVFARLSIRSFVRRPNTIASALWGWCSPGRWTTARSGLIAIKEAGGTAIVQHPYEAFVPSMPLSAIQNVEVDHIVRTDEIAGLLVQAAEGQLARRTGGPPLADQTAADPTQRDINLSAVPPDAIEEPPSKFVCPECGGSLWEVEEAGLMRYRCFTGHGFTPDTLLAAQNGKLEDALWSAVRVLMERAALHRQMAQRMAARGMDRSSVKYQERAQQEEKHADTIRQMLSTPPLSAEPLLPDVDQSA
jgi:two-component system chemotaxis response regulator CheB